MFNLCSSVHHHFFGKTTDEPFVNGIIHCIYCSTHQCQANIWMLLGNHTESHALKWDFMITVEFRRPHNWVSSLIWCVANTWVFSLKPFQWLRASARVWLCKNSGERLLPQDLIRFQVTKSPDLNPMAEYDYFHNELHLSIRNLPAALPFVLFAHERDCLVHAKWILFVIPLFIYIHFQPTENMSVHKMIAQKCRSVCELEKLRYARRLFSTKWNVMVMFGFH